MTKNARYNEGKKVTIVSILTNMCLIFFKLLAGILGQSSAMIADAVHSISDLVTDIVVIFGLKYSTQPSDEQHPYGHEKIETLVSLILGIFLVGVGIKIGYDGIKAIFYHPPVSPTMIAVVAAFVSLASKEILYRYTVWVGKKIKSRAVIANAWHHRSDALSSLVAAIGIIGSMSGFRILDPLAAAFIAIFIIIIGIEISMGASSELIESSVDEELVGKIRKIAIGTPRVAGAHKIRARQIGSSIFAEIHIEVTADMNVADSHFIAEEVEKKIKENIKTVKEVLVHVEPFEKNKD